MQRFLRLAVLNRYSNPISPTDLYLNFYFLVASVWCHRRIEGCRLNAAQFCKFAFGPVHISANKMSENFVTSVF